MNVTEADAERIALALGKAKRSGKEWSCLCPSHKDTDPSFSVTAEDGKLLVCCHRGCDQKTVIAELRWRRLWPEPEKTNGAAGKATQSRIVATYDYHDANGQMIFQAVRKEPKAFLQRQPDGKGGWIWNLEGVETVLYRLPELVAADPVDYVYIPEGEKDVDRLRSIGLVATTNPMGAGKWRTSFNKWLRKRHVIILPDNDPQDTKPDGTLKFHDDGRPVFVGKDHATYIASCLRNVAASVRILELPDLPLKGDVSDWLDAKHTVNELVDLTKAALLYVPEKANRAATIYNTKRRAQHKTQDGVALEFSARYIDKLRFCHHTGKWFSWDGCIWRREETQLAFDFARTICREFGGKRLARASDAGAVERFARADRAFAVTSEIWDRDTYLLGTPAGTVDLRTGDLRSVNIADFISRSTSVTPAEVPECPLWLDFIDKVTCQRTDLCAFLQRWFGYCLTGDTGEHSLLFCYGTGGNGKGVMLNTIATIFGDYAQIAPMDTFTASVGDKHSTDLAGLKGARMVLASETEEGRSWDEQRVKSITGGDPISARFMRQDFFTYKPQFKPVIYGNYKPNLRNVDDAMRRRLKLVPFDWKPPKVIVNFDQTLIPEYPAILRWVIDGCLAWQANGLAPPDTVQSTTEDYFAEQDVIARWADECCEFGPSHEYGDKSGRLFGAWRAFALANGEEPGSAKRFKAMLEKLPGVCWAQVPAGLFRGRGFTGIRVRPQEPEPHWQETDL